MMLNNIKITSPSIEIEKNKNSFFVNGQFLKIKKTLILKLKLIFDNLFKDIDIQKIEFSSKNNFSFNVNKNLKFDNLKVAIRFKSTNFNEKYLKLKPYFQALLRR